MKNFINAVLIIAYRDLLKFLYDRGRIIATFIFPLVFILVLGNSLQSNLGKSTGINFLAFTFTGVLAQTLFQSASSGVISLVEDRENDFSQEMFVAPVSRFAIILGKIIGESTVALIQALGIIIFGVITRIPITFSAFLNMIPTMIVACLIGASFGIIVLSFVSSQRAANQVFPFILFPQFFLSGLFAPVKSLPWYLLILSRIAPLTYVVDLTRHAYYSGASIASVIIVFPLYVDLLVAGVMFTVFLTFGTYLFVNSERNK